MTIATRRELFAAVREGFDYGAIDGTTKPEELREFYNVDEELSDDEIERTFISVFNGQTHDVLVAVSVGSGAVFGSKTINTDDGLLVEDIEALSTGMTHDIGSTVDLRMIRFDEDSSDAAFRLILMPEGLYDAGHGEHVKRYGRDLGLYRNLAAA